VHSGLYRLICGITVKYIPSWFPGASFKRKAREWRKLSRDLIERPFEAVKHKMVSRRYFGLSGHSFLLRQGCDTQFYMVLRHRTERSGLLFQYLPNLLHVFRKKARACLLLLPRFWKRFRWQIRRSTKKSFRTLRQWHTQVSNNCSGYPKIYSPHLLAGADTVS